MQEDKNVVNIFDWMREQTKQEEVDMNPYPFIFTDDALEIINEAEAKWESDCCEWYERDVEDLTYHSHDDKEFDYKNDVERWKFCPYCRKRIKILEIE